MRLQERLKADLKSAMLAKDEDKKNAIRVVMGELGRLDTKAPDDAQVIQVLKKLIKNEREMLEKSGGGADTPFIGILDAYLPQMASEDEIRTWIQANVDFGKYKNKMQAMREIMAHFGANADGNLVKAILQKF